MANQGQLLHWRPGHGLQPCDRPVEREALLCADSWLVSEGMVRGIAEHRARFLAGVRSVGSEAERVLGDLDAFWSAALDALPRIGGWFPRVELVGGVGDSPVLRLRVRRAPALDDVARVWVLDRPDPRRHPTRKGPDLEMLATVRARAAALGANEALLSGSEGVLHEAANSSLIWWEGDRLCVPSKELPVLSGVTSLLITREARRRGVSVVPRTVRLPDLAGREVWLTNALHGIRPVMAWVGADVSVGPPVRLAGWRTWLAGVATPLPDRGRVTPPA